MQVRERKLQRLKGYDYSQSNYYFVTVCCKNREQYLGEIKDNEMILNNFGKLLNFLGLIYQIITVIVLLMNL